MLASSFQSSENNTWSDWSVFQLYSPDNETWTTIRHMSTGISLAGVGVIGNQLYVVGGL